MSKVGRPSASIVDLYNSYVEQYVKSQNYVSKRGGHTPYDMATFEDFSIDFRYEYADLRNEGYKFNSKQVAERMARNDAYGHSIEQANAWSNAIAKKQLETGNITQDNLNEYQRKIRNDIRLGKKTQATEEFWNSVRDRRAELKSQQKDSNNISLIISQEFFGS